MSNREGRMLSDEELWNQFLDARLSREDWTHRAHVRIGFLHVSKHPFAESLELIRTRIQQLNEAHGTPETPDRGYHETITYAFLRLIAYAAQHESHINSDAFCESHPELLDRRVLLHYYSRDRIMSMQAKSAFVEPDVKLLPDLHDRTRQVRHLDRPF